ncbi:hypothetical protein CEUSTIGMA_g11443.t1 [Chlamydomonas eustigma]|uniref:Mediator of RNA polymerase II transcription subunit 20 n=1 Tax=Chlamydomonas eustigma TaxID=1157962 RepID=A0A250XLR2_9CHLO|nr:hypothetical protein CEUSTIGMA_g11443.t1 [Chlamydomonas eustigma]|eukprot:GAX84018.1 hypothetical protein CEUSTIGMA_g11443.t1 [Chlamydomonas eustigma]
MGVKWMLRWRPAPGISVGIADEELLIQTFESFNVRKAQDPVLKAQCQFFKQVPQTTPHGSEVEGKTMMKDMWVVNFNEAPETSYLLNRRSHKVMECENAVMSIVEKKMDYKNRNTVRFEGKCFSKGDFQVRLASLTQTITGVSGQQVNLGYVVEVEYSPLLNMEVARPIMEEFIAMLTHHIPRRAVQVPSGKSALPDTTLVGSLEPVHPHYEKYYGLPNTYSWQHAAVLYAEIAVASLNAT